MLVIRRATLGDAMDMADREKECFTMEGWNLDCLLDGMKFPGRIFLLAVDDGKPVGHGCITSICGEGEISNIAVNGSSRRQGVAKRIMEELLETGKSLGDEAFTLEVRETNTAAIALYEKMGFASVGIRPHFYKEPDEGAIIMWKR